MTSECQPCVCIKYLLVPDTLALTVWEGHCSNHVNNVRHQENRIGRLSFIQNGINVHLRSKYIFVRAGELFIGSEEEPFQDEAKITLHGNQDDETLVLSGTVSAGNKILATFVLVNKTCLAVRWKSWTELVGFEKSS